MPISSSGSSSGGTRLTIPTSLTGNTPFTNVTAGNGAKGSWVQIIASTSAAWTYMQLILHIPVVATTDFYVDLGTGAGGSEVVIIPDLYTNVAAADTSQDHLFFVKIPAATRIAVRAQQTGGTGTVRVVVIGG